MKAADMHCDTVSRIMDDEQGGSLRKNNFHVDVEKLQQGEYLLQNFAMFVDMEEHPDSYAYCNKMIDRFYGELESCCEYIRPVRSYSDIEENLSCSRISALLTVEEGGVCGGDISKLQELYTRGVRMLTLTWNYKNELGFSNRVDENGVRHEDEHLINTTSGLTRTGFEFVEEMERIGMIIDVSHLSDAGFYDVLRASKKPFVASHSNARSVCPHCRNLTDDMIRRLSERGGLMGLNFCPNFVEDITFEEYEQGGRGGLKFMAEHVKHIIDVGGCECLGLGSDFDGIPKNDALTDCSCIQMLAQALEDAGMPHSTVEAVFYKNVLRLYREML